MALPAISLEVVSKKSSWFSDFAKNTARAAGHPIIFALAGGVVILWLITGPLFGFSDTWQLIINTGTTIVTFLMVFLIQRTQNKESLAVQLKLNELIAAVKGASNRMIDVEDLPEDEIFRLHDCFCKLAEHARARGKLKGSLSVDSQMASNAMPAVEKESADSANKQPTHC
jgi:low affinity Fe/Cu permease